MASEEVANELWGDKLKSQTAYICAKPIVYQLSVVIVERWVSQYKNVKSNYEMQCSLHML